MTKKTENTPKSNIPANLIGELDKLGKQRLEWENGAYKTSNQQLYGILARCLDIYQLMRDDLHQRKLLQTRLVQNNIKFKSSTNLATRIVRYVFRNDGNRSFAYSRVIISANEHKIDSTRLPSWITENGGIEQVRRKDKAGLTVTQQAEQFTQAAIDELSKVKAISDSFKPHKSLLPDAEGTHISSLALVRKGDDGNSTIVYGTAKPSLVKRMLALAGKEITEQKANKKEAAKRRSAKSERATLARVA